MKYWYDTEFLEDGRMIAPISVGIVAEDGREYYAIFKGAPWERVKKHPWLMENVVPHLPMGFGPSREFWPRRWLFNMDDPCVKDRDQIKTEVQDFFLRHNEPVELWGYYSSYDHVLLSQLFGRMIDRPKGLPMWTNDVQQLAYQLGLEDSLPKQESDLHNALADARWTRDVWLYLDAKVRQAAQA